jgi:hypothetical protein
MRGQTTRGNGENVVYRIGSSLHIAAAFAIQAVLAYQADAVTITFIEAGEGPTATSVDLAGCPGCILVAATGAVEAGTASFTAPAGFFAGLPMGQSFAQAILVEPPGVPGEVAGAISDTVLLDISNTPAIISVLANFTSDSENVTTFPPAGFPTVPETGGMQNLSGNFVIQTAAGGFAPFPLPGNLVIQVQSDLVPEPPGLVLLGSGALALVAVAVRRKRCVCE